MTAVRRTLTGLEGGPFAIYIAQSTSDRPGRWVGILAQSVHEFVSCHTPKNSNRSACTTRTLRKIPPISEFAFGSWAVVPTPRADRPGYALTKIGTGTVTTTCVDMHRAGNQWNVVPLIWHGGQVCLDLMRCKEETGRSADAGRYTHARNVTIGASVCCRTTPCHRAISI